MAKQKVDIYYWFGIPYYHNLWERNTIQIPREEIKGIVTQFIKGSELSLVRALFGEPENISIFINKYGDFGKKFPDYISSISFTWDNFEIHYHLNASWNGKDFEYDPSSEICRINKYGDFPIFGNVFDGKKEWNTFP